MNRARLRALAAAACAVWASCACPVLAQTVADAKFVRSEIRVGGNVERVLVLSVEDLQRIPVQHLEERRIVGAPGNGTESLRRFTGCRLRDVLDAAVLTERTRRDLRRSYVVAAASDGYEVVFSWGELYNSPAGDGVLVVYAIDGAPLPDGEGRIALVSLNDTRPGPRHVKWLARIDVRQASN